MIEVNNQKDVLLLLKEIETIAKYQQNRLNQETPHKKEIILTESLMFINAYTTKILRLLR